MRALCGAIITAGALLGLGLTAMGLGNRYTTYYDRGTNGVVDFAKSQVQFRDLDNPMKLILVILVIGVVVGLAVAFLGLMYHHHRRHHELLHHHNSHAGAPPRATV
jgi:hypothetical protein